MGYIGQDEVHLESPGTPSCDSLQTSNPMQSSGLALPLNRADVQSTEDALASGRGAGPATDGLAPWPEACARSGGAIRLRVL